MDIYQLLQDLQWRIEQGIGEAQLRECIVKLLEILQTKELLERR